eukprot:TRINITY_DN22613_c0_g1_i1.p1 TRINITY_DN22613_c0_g1~~TRINITY_DN22613_c0_g1_i1.p1  ORF type:complete len:710 (+),score=210.88 TRINITY_DN22613_c0_g1_i1:91-2130(+)
MSTILTAAEEPQPARPSFLGVEATLPPAEPGGDMPPRHSTAGSTMRQPSVQRQSTTQLSRRRSRGRSSAGGDTEPELARQERRLCVLEYPGFASSGPHPIPVQGGHMRDTAYIMEQTLRWNRVGRERGLGRLMLSRPTLDIFCDTFWWIFLRYFSMIDLMDLAEKHQCTLNEEDPHHGGGPPTALVEAAAAEAQNHFCEALRGAGAMPLHTYSTQYAAATRPIAVLARSAAPGTARFGTKLEALSDLRSTASSRSGLSSPSSPGSTRSSVGSIPQSTGEQSGASDGAIPCDLSALTRWQREQVIEEDERKLYDRISSRYLKIARTIAKVRPATAQDRYYTHLPDLLAQAVWLAFHRSMPYAQPLLGVQFQGEVLAIVTYWMAGVERNNVSHWGVRMDTQSPKKRRFQQAPQPPTKARARQRSSVLTALQPRPPTTGKGGAAGLPPRQSSMQAKLPAVPAAGAHAVTSPPAPGASATRGPGEAKEARGGVQLLRSAATGAVRTHRMMENARVFTRGQLDSFARELIDELSAIGRPATQNYGRAGRLSPAQPSAPGGAPSGRPAALGISAGGGASPGVPGGLRGGGGSRFANKVRTGDQRKRPWRISVLLKRVKEKMGKGTLPWYETGRIKGTNQAPRVRKASFCVQDYSPLLQHAILHRLYRDNHNAGRPAHMLWTLQER